MTLVRYLGVNIVRNQSKLYKVNYNQAIPNIRKDTERWITHLLDFGRTINVIKMAIVPRLFYLFQALPAEVPQSQFIAWGKLISRFVWDGKRPRVRFATLQLGHSFQSRSR